MIKISVVDHIPTTTVILIKCVVGILLFIISKAEYQQQLYNAKYWQFDCCWYSNFLIINSGIPTTQVINITVVVGIWFTTVKMASLFICNQLLL